MEQAAAPLVGAEAGVHPVLLEWNDISYTVKAKNAEGKLADKPVLKDLTGHAAPGSFTVILGASGSGKTSLLSVLADRLLYSKGATLTGELKINAEAPPADYRSHCAYVQQTDVFYPFSTVRETVEMAACLRLGSTKSKAEKIQRASDVIKQLGLTKALDTKVGDGNRVKGISGGEMKRVSIGCELVSSPSLVMLDEPTSGLDSTAALKVVQGLNDLAASGHTVIASIHQPGSAIYALFGTVVVLAEGELAYIGPAANVVKHFGDIGYACPPMFNPAEHVLDVTSAELRGSESEEDKSKRLQKIKEHGSTTVTLARQVSQGMGTPMEANTACVEQFSLLYRRILKDAMRNKFALILKFVQSISTTVITVGLYSNLTGGGVVPIITANISALLFFVTINGLFGPLFSTIQAFAPEVNIVLRERMNNLYGMAPYYLAKLLVALPVELLPLVVGNTVAFWLLKLDHSADRYLEYLIFTCGMTFSSVGLGFMLAAATGGNIQAASGMVGPIALIFLLLGGFFINTSTIPVWIAWLSKVSYVSWSFQGLCISQFQGRSISAPGYALMPDGSCQPGATPQECQDGSQILGDLFNNGIARSDHEWVDMMWTRFVFILICIGVFNFLGYLVLLAKGPKYLRLTARS
eukprot:TRINITY_DN14231_c0_g1_i1.p1 TRINITY_DN14231_c0_g1~~TRINITY_DN14231_c0_g1_i1.p1  ORF type:complete len:657 (-),score=110.32 TRINITY_DN14231_c0_g1_i1:378-2291(-)